MEENIYWKRVNKHTWLDKDNGNKADAFDFNIDLDNYDEKTLVPGLRDFIRQEIVETKYQTINRNKLLKRFFEKWKEN